MKLPQAVNRRSVRRALMRVALYGSAIAVAFVVIKYPDAIVRNLGISGAKTVKAAREQYEARVKEKFRPLLVATGNPWPPQHIELIALKAERILEVWAGSKRGALVRIASYPFKAASGRLGPKLKEGDRQVPEGIYPLPSLNPNSQFHLSIVVDYPNQDDIDRAIVPREQMGGEVFVHGNTVSVGCVAIGDEAIEEVFTLAALVDAENREIIISPFDFRAPPTPRPELPPVPGLYEKIEAALADFPIAGAQTSGRR